MNCFALNKFALTEEFQLIRPKMYVLPDRRFWDASYSDKDLEVQTRLFKAFNKVDWQMQIFIPQDALQYFQSNIDVGKFVQLIPYKLRALPIKGISLSAWALHWRLCTQFQ